MSRARGTRAGVEPKVGATVGRVLGLVLSLLFARPAQAQSEPAAAPAIAASSALPERAARPVAETVSIAVPGAGVEMHTLVYRPPGAGPFPVLVFSHGRAIAKTARAELARPMPLAQVSFWLAHGYAVVAPVRPGYGASGGADLEFVGLRVAVDGRCISRPEFGAVLRHAVPAVQAALDWVRAQPWADARRIVLQGQSVGGLATVATAAARPEGVLAAINFAGGAGGDPTRAPGRSCDPEQLGAIYTALGRTTRIPNVWIYAVNDQFWGADAPKAWHAGFAAGGSPTQFIEAPPVADGDGHGLSRHAPALWAGYLDEFLRTHGLPGAVTSAAPTAHPR